MTPFRIAILSTAAVSLAACTNYGGQYDKPWAPEFGQTNTQYTYPAQQQNSQYGQYPLPQHSQKQASVKHMSPVAKPQPYGQPQGHYSAPQQSYSQNYGQQQYMQPQQQQYAQPQQQHPQTQQQYAQPQYMQSQQHYAQPQQGYGQSQTMQPMAYQQPQMPAQPMQPQEPRTQMIPWGQAIGLMYKGYVQTATQAHSGQVTLALLNGTSVITHSPRVDEVMRVKQDCGPTCQNMMIATE